MELLESTGDGVEMAVKIGHLGTFNMESVKLFQSACDSALLAAKVADEEKWFFQTSSNTPEMIVVKNILRNSKPHDVIAKHGSFIMDATDFSTLACERYLNGFTIDATCLKLLEVGKPTTVVYLPSYSQIWAKQGVEYFSHKVSEYFAHCPVEDTTFILTPVHYEVKQHWGMLCFHTTCKTVYFDDGLKVCPAPEIHTVVKNMLGGFKTLSRKLVFEEECWNSPSLASPLPRFDMPHQPKSGEGSGSCGMGVTLSVRDIIASDSAQLPSFKWSFTNMNNLRRELMALILQWKI